MDIKALREKHNLSAQDLATALGVSVSTISRWETGKHQPSKLATASIKAYIDSLDCGGDKNGQI